MATVNITKQFKSLLTETVKFRAEVVMIDQSLNRVKVKWGDHNIWVTAISSLTIGDFVLVEDNTILNKLPILPYYDVEVF